MAAKKKSRRRSKNFTLPVAVIGGFMPMATYVVDGMNHGGINASLARVGIATTGYNAIDGKFYPKAMASKMAPVLLGMVIHKFAGKLGINRMLASAGVPVVRL